MFRNRLSLVLVACFLGLFAAFVWRRPIDGFFPLFIFCCLAAGWVGLLYFNDQQPPARASLWLFLPPMFFSITAVLTREYPTALKHVLSLVFTFLYLALLAVSYRGGRLAYYTWGDYKQNLRRLALSVLWRPAQFLWQLARDYHEATKDRPRSSDHSGLYAALLAVIFFLVLPALLCTADPVMLTMLMPRPGPEPPDEVIVEESAGPGGMLGWTLLWSYVTLGVLLYAAAQSQDERLIADDPQVFRRWFNYTGSSMVYASVLVPLISYSTFRAACAIQPAMCLDSKGFPAGINPDIGFWGLALGAGLVFLGTNWLERVTAFADQTDRRVHLALLGLIFLFTVVVLWNAGWGVSTTTLGFTAPRHVLYARGALVWLATMFGMFIAYAAIQRERDYPYAALIVTTVMVALFVMAAMLLGGTW